MTVKINSITDKYICFIVSSSRGGMHDIIYDRLNMQWSCTCEDYWYRKRTCKHCKEAIQFLKDLAFEIGISTMPYVGDTTTPYEIMRGIV